MLSDLDVFSSKLQIWGAVVYIDKNFVQLTMQEKLWQHKAVLPAYEYHKRAAETIMPLV
jgi:hypothetical protein